MKKVLFLFAVLTLLSVCMVIPSYALDYQVKGLEKSYWYLPGVQSNGNEATGAALDAFYGPFAQVKLKNGYVLTELAVPAGMGTRFGEVNSTEGDKITVHVGAALCQLDRKLCESGTYNMEMDNLFSPDRSEWRFQINADVTAIPGAIATGIKFIWNELGGK